MRRYVQGLLSDSPRKSMEAMLARGTDPGGYQAFQHFITDAPWSADGVWRCLRAVLPEREGLVIFAGTSFPKPGTSRSGWPARYCGRGESRQWPSGGHRGAVDRAARLLAGGRALCARGVADRRRPRSGAASPGCPVAAKWRQALTLLRQVRRQRPHRHRRAGRCGVWRYRPVSGHVASVAAPLCGGDFSSQTVFLGRPRLGHRRGGRLGRPRTRPDLAAGVRAYTVAQAPRRSRGGGPSAGATAAAGAAGRSSVWPCG